MKRERPSSDMIGRKASFQERSGSLHIYSGTISTAFHKPRL
jgi:hypothetical protein